MLRIFATFFFILLAGATFSQDRNFARTYQTNVLPKGTFDIEYWTTLRTGKVGAFSPFAFGRSLDSRIELEYGLGGNVQTAFYFNATTTKFAMLDTSAAELETETEVETSFSNEWKFKLSDPVANAIGTALYFEVGAGADEYEFETKLLFDKRLGDELFALNLVGELELETEAENEANGEAEREMEWELPMEVDFGYMHFFKPRFGLGLEARTHFDYVPDEGLEHNVLFAGPTMFVSSGKFFATLNVQPQLMNFYKTAAAPGDKVLDAHENMETRLLVGFSF